MNYLWIQMVHVYKNKTNHPISSNSHPSATANAKHCLKLWGESSKKPTGTSYNLTKNEAVHPTDEQFKDYCLTNTVFCLLFSVRKLTYFVLL